MKTRQYGKIDFIKAIREATGYGLKISKDMVDLAITRGLDFGEASDDVEVELNGVYYGEGNNIDEFFMMLFETYQLLSRAGFSDDQIGRAFEIASQFKSGQVSLAERIIVARDNTRQAAEVWELCVKRQKRLECAQVINTVI